MVTRPPHFNPFEFAVVSGLRAHQLMDGCLPQLDGEHNATTMAQMEVASGKISRASRLSESAGPVSGDRRTGIGTAPPSSGRVERIG
ncbi:MAG: DNA-directed RNA polymerase subunit omega [Acidobacteria bacterium]|nr:DNA-directed RNA polymerase subunit omega [Acidobacteriota bacterium]